MHSPDIRPYQPIALPDGSETSPENREEGNLNELARSIGQLTRSAGLLIYAAAFTLLADGSYRAAKNSSEILMRSYTLLQGGDSFWAPVLYGVAKVGNATSIVSNCLWYAGLPVLGYGAYGVVKNLWNILRSTPDSPKIQPTGQ
jgi:hypothetical protein